jgi:LDH2 family malate/lactate/ureidoglycolate dehydrogenase
VSVTAHYRLDDLRRFAARLGAAAGLAPARASTLAAHLLWYDVAGAARWGLATLPELLDRIAAGELDPAAEVVVQKERSGTALVDGRRGLPLVVLDRAAGIATEKARDAGVGLVRVENVAAPGSAAVIAAEVTRVGPFLGAVLGPGPSRALAVTSGDGLAAVHDASLSLVGSPPYPDPFEACAAAWLGWLAPDEGWLVAAVSVEAMGGIDAFHSRVSAALKGRDENGGLLLPGPSDARRRAASEHGLAVAAEAWTELIGRAARLGVTPPAPLSRSTPEPHPA